MSTLLFTEFPSTYDDDDDEIIIFYKMFILCTRINF